MKRTQDSIRLSDSLFVLLTTRFRFMVSVTMIYWLERSCADRLSTVLWSSFLTTTPSVLNQESFTIQYIQYKPSHLMLRLQLKIILFLLLARRTNPGIDFRFRIYMKQDIIRYSIPLYLGILVYIFFLNEKPKPKDQRKSMSPQNLEQENGYISLSINIFSHNSTEASNSKKGTQKKRKQRI